VLCLDRIRAVGYEPIDVDAGLDGYLERLA